MAVTPGGTQSVHEEFGYYPGWVYILLACLLALFIILLVIMASAGQALAAVIMGFGFAIVLFAFVFFGRLSFVITDSEVDFGIRRPFRKRFARGSIMYCEPYTLRFANYGGYGWRLGLDGTTAVNTRSGPGVKIAFAGAKRPYAISIDDPEKVCAILLGKPGR